MCNCCQQDGCERSAVNLCEGHLRHFVLKTLADLFDQAAVDLFRELEADQEDD